MADCRRGSRGARFGAFNLFAGQRYEYPKINGGGEYAFHYHRRRQRCRVLYFER